MDDRVVWGAALALLLVGEALGLELVGVMLAVGALAGLLAAAVGAPFAVQALAAGAVGGLMLVAVRPVARRHLAVRGLPNDPAAALAGVTAVVVEQVRDDAGQVRVHGELWAARPALPGTVLHSGSAVWIGAVSGATLLVHPLPAPDDPLETS